MKWIVTKALTKECRILTAIDFIVNRYNRNMDIEKLFERAQLDIIIFSMAASKY
ncbi:MAG: hypothetical protein PHG94_10510 [Syntrophomonas sp.]|uniref:hypothetical protein n=1 Tax=Syntrophomonas sp. TaxID=2053627 RepID=UPI00260FDBA7|nr:hypothetical protein [Syntrophomonas sp.]MDD2511540.1 hypothetical protein [Syntrophomonas sp.]MDD4627634.1 hypothetical protein [Syntrophomonas sp.]